MNQRIKWSTMLATFTIFVTTAAFGGLVPVPKTGQTISHAAGDDGDLQKGAAWPVPRFTDHQDGTVTDNLTGLMWTKDANMYGTRTWANALSDCASCTEGGHSDWHLPNVRELYSLIDYGQYDPTLPAGHPFSNVQPAYYWSSTTLARYTSYAWSVNLLSGHVSDDGKHGDRYVWCVRDYDNSIDSGWSMISLPVKPEIPTVANVFPQAVVVYRYQQGTGYVRVQAGEELEVGMGYWILLDNPQSFVIKGTEITEYTIPMSDGWYMIGGCSMPAQAMVTSGKIDVIYGYTKGIGYERILESEPLERGKGYWIKFSDASEIAAFTACTPGLVPVPKTGQIISHAAGDDGDLQKGAAWPVPRFTDHQDGTVTDNLTGLMWTKDANMYGTRTWANALSDCASCTEGGHSDWHLPNVRELYSLIDYSQYDPTLPTGHPFSNVQPAYYWSSTTLARYTSYAWSVNLLSGHVSGDGKYGDRYVWCVRGGQ